MRTKPITVILVSVVALLITVSVLANEELPELEPLMPGRIEGSGIYFKIEDSEYLNLVLKSNEEIKVVLESIPRMISLEIEATFSASSTLLTIEGLEPNKTYYKYQDSYKNEAVFISSENGSYSWTQDLTKSHHIWIQEGRGTIFINTDTILTSDLSESVEITADNISLDCNGHSITGSSTGYGVYLNNRKGVTIKNCNLTNFSYGIFLYSSLNIEIDKNDISNARYGIRLDYSPNNKLTNNIASSNIYSGICLMRSGDNILIDNTANLNKKHGIFLWEDSSHEYTNDNTLTNNTVNSNDDYGIFLYNSCNNTLTNNKVANNNHGLVVDSASYNNTLTGNLVSSNNYGIWLLRGARNNTLTNNTASDNHYYGIYLWWRISNSQINNNILSNNGVGIYLGNSSDNSIYHNNFINNWHHQAIIDHRGVNNLFDDGYPSGGNYWSDYIGVDLYSGPNQDEPGGDGMGDSLYTFLGGEDRYPFMEESGWGVPPVPSYNVAVILAEPNNISHDSSSTSAQPCKLLPEKTYPNGRSKEYYQDLVYCVADYNKENSFETIDLDFEIFDDNGNWFKTDKNEQDYLGKEHEFVAEAIDLATDKGVDLSDKDIIIVIHSGEAARTKEDIGKKLITMTWGLISQPLEYPPYKIIVAEDDFVGAWAHEIGHIIGALITPQNTITPDLYKMGNVGKWDVMAMGSRNDDGKNPPYMSSYTKEFLQWLNYDIHPKSAYGEYWINSLETSKSGDGVFRYNLSDDTDDLSPKYYILEGRNRNLETWDSSLPEEKALVLYKVDTRNYPEYGYAPDGVMNNQYRTIDIPFFDSILTPDGDSHLDMRNLVYITALSDEQTAEIYRIKSKIEKVDYDFFEDRFRGVILEPSSQFYQKIIQYLPFHHYPFRFELEYRKAFREHGALIELPHPDVARKQIIEEISVILASFVLLNLLLILLKIKVIPRLKSESRKRITQILLRIFWIICIVVFIILLYLYFFEMRTLADIFEYIIGTPGIETSTIVEDIKALEWGVVNFSFGLLILFIPLSLSLLFIDKVIISRWKLERGRGTIKTIFRIVWLITLVVFIIFIICFALPKISFSREIEESNTNTNIINPQPKGLSAPLLQSVFPDLDLHLYCEDGKHIGMNYETGEYEIQISGAMVSGDNQDAPEWIFIPEDITGCHFVVSSYDNQKFLEENPEIAQEIEDTTDGYDVYARYIDPATDIYTSTIISENIQPATELEHPISGTHDVTIEPGILLARVDLDPDTLNLKSKGKWLTVYIELPVDYDVNDINLESIKLNGQIPIETKPTEISDYDGNGIPDLMVKFDQSAVQAILEIGEEVEIVITGELIDGRLFQGSDIIKVISKGNQKEALAVVILACFAVGGLLVYRRRFRKINRVLNEKSE